MLKYLTALYLWLFNHLNNSQNDEYDKGKYIIQYESLICLEKPYPGNINNASCYSDPYYIPQN